MHMNGENFGATSLSSAMACLNCGLKAFTNPLLTGYPVEEYGESPDLDYEGDPMTIEEWEIDLMVRDYDLTFDEGDCDDLELWANDQIEMMEHGSVLNIING